MLPRLVCAGTLWQGGTQMACVDADTGKPKWHGTMPFWSAIVPQGHETTVTAATINGLSRRYPYSGVEMRLKSFDVAGGRTAYYATDSKAVFFVGESTDSPHMTAYDIGSLEPRWRLALPARPQPTWTYAFEAFGVVLFEINQHVYAADTDTGQVLWAAQVGADQPPVAAVGESLYMLIRRETEANQLVKIEPRSGDIGWRAAVPTGSLDIMSYDDALMLRSVRAVQKVVDLE